MASVQKHIALVCNPTVEINRAIQVADAIAVLLKSKKVSFSLFTAYWPQEWASFSEVWIIGGDGTVNYFINQYPHLQLPLAVFAAGSGNDLHWMLYGHLALEQQVNKVLHAAPKLIDGGVCNGQLFLNGVGIGFDGAIVKDLVGRKKLKGKASYLLAVLKQIFKYREKHCTLQFKGETRAQDCFMISISNGRRYGGGFMVTPMADVNDALLDVMIAGQIAAAKRIKYLPVIEKGEHLALPFVSYHQIAAITVTADVDLPAHMDGEYICGRQFQIQCLPNRFSFLL